MAVGATACTKEVVESRADKNLRIDFSTLLTRGSAISGNQSLALAGGFHVWGYSYSDAGSWATTTPVARSAVFEGDRVTSLNGATWSYGEPKKWPENEKISFFAYAPYNCADGVEYDINGVPQIAFSVDNIPALQKDLLIATPVYDRVGPNPVNIIFDHALSRIHFSALVSGEVNAAIKVTNVTLKNLYYRGTASLQTPVVWDVDLSSVRDYSLSTALGLQDVGLTSVAQSISTEELFLMPQTLDRVVQIPEMTVTFTVGELGQEQEFNYTCPIPKPEGDKKWKPGRSYDFRICIDGESIEVIVIDEEITLKEWKTEGVVQTVVLGSDPAKNTIAIHSAISAFNELKAIGGHNNSTDFLIYFAGDINHNLTINLHAAATGSFTFGDEIVLDFDTYIGNWGAGCKVTILYDSNDWYVLPDDVIDDKDEVILFLKNYQR